MNQKSRENTKGKVLNIFLLIFFISFIIIVEVSNKASAHYIQTHQTIISFAKNALVNAGPYTSIHNFLDTTFIDPNDGVEKTYLRMLKEGARDADRMANGFYGTEKLYQDCWDLTQNIPDSDCSPAYWLRLKMPGWPVGDHYYDPEKGTGLFPTYPKEYTIDQLKKPSDPNPFEIKPYEIGDPIPSVGYNLLIEEVARIGEDLDQILQTSNAADMARHFYNQAKNEWDNFQNADRLRDAMYNLGVALHLVQDLTVPHHARPGNEPQEYDHKYYERYVWETELEEGNKIYTIKLTGDYSDFDAMTWVKRNAGKSFNFSRDPTISAEESVRLGVSSTIGLIGSFFRSVGYIPPHEVLGPIAKAGWDNFAKVGEIVTLDGSASLDPSDGQLSYLWTEDYSNPVTGLISNGNQAEVQITPPTKGGYLFNLKVSNTNGHATESVTIHVIDPNDIPEGEAISGILDTYRAYKVAYESQDIDAIMDLYHPDYGDGSWQDGPRDKSIQRQILEEQFNNHQTLKIDHNIYSANLQGPSEDNLIEADLFLFQTIYQVDLQGKESYPRDSYSTKLRKDEQTGKWLMYGDQLPFGAFVQSIYGKDEWGPWTGVWVGVRADRWDPNQGVVTNPITSVYLDGPALPQAGIELDYNSAGKRWDIWKLLTEDPSVGWTYHVNVYRSGLFPVSRTLRITNVLEGYPNPLYPASPGYPQAPEYGVSLEPVFQWSDQCLKDQLYYRVTVSNSRTYDDVIWQRYDIKGRGVRYNDDNLGDPLEPDQLYYWRVRARDKDINGATADWQIFFTEPTDGKYTPRVEAYPKNQGVITYRWPDNSLTLRFRMRAYDPDGSINEGDLVAYGPGNPGPLLGQLYYNDYRKLWQLHVPASDQTNLSGEYTVRVTDADAKFSEFNEFLDFNPLPSTPVISFPKDTTITTVVPNLQWTTPPGATRTFIEIRNDSNQRIFDYWIIGANEFQLPGGILAPEQDYRWYAWSVREEDSSEIGHIDNVADSGWAYFSVGQVLEVDTDRDGLFDSIEAIIGTDPNDKDSDDDGLMDGDEDKNHNGVVEPSLGETDPNDLDSDDDLVQDGTEKGINAAIADPDGAGPLLGTDTSIFKPDVEPNTATNPLYWDSDFDGLPDGVEDDGECNPAHAQNGRLDSCETDPLDDDTDDDGLTDGPWGSEDMNANGRLDPGETDAVDADSDDDGIQDGTEKGLTAPEGTGTDATAFIPDEDPWTTTDPTDPDSDGDGIPDGVEDSNKNGKTDEGETSAEVYTVKMDIFPDNCPNYLDVKAKGILPVAVLGSGAINVTQIEPGTVLLKGIAPKRWNVEDVTSPHDCLYNYEYPDGEPDLTLKFDRQAIISTLGEVNNGVVITLNLTGNLNSGESFEAIDSVIIVKE